MDIKFLNNQAQMPTRGTADAAGWDLYAAVEHDAVIPAHETRKIGTGIAVAIPKGYFGALFARSGLATKQSLRPANCVGVIDSDYRGELIVAMHNDSDRLQIVSNGERIAQLVIIPYAPIEFNRVVELDATDRGEGGFGSTGLK